MADKRMFSKTIIDSDAFLEMQQSAQLLYFHLSMRADDDGFINKPKTIMRMVGCKEDDLRVLVSRKFIIPFDTGVVVIKHWKIHNYIAKDRYHETNYKEEMAMLQLDENKAYTLEKNSSYTDCIQVVDKMETQVRLGKDSIGKDRLEEESKGKDKEKHKVAKAPAVYYPNDELLNQTFTDYVEMRKQLKKPMTDKAVQLAIKNLEKLSGGDNDKAIKILEQSVMNSWLGLFELKGDKQTPQKTGGIDWDNV